jgi:hypothetical protein
MLLPTLAAMAVASATPSTGEVVTVLADLDTRQAVDAFASRVSYAMVEPTATARGT